MPSTKAGNNILRERNNILLRTKWALAMEIVADSYRDTYESGCVDVR